MPNHLIANSGLQFICNEMTINPSESPEVENDKQLGYCFIVQNDNGALIYDFLHEPINAKNSVFTKGITERRTVKKGRHRYWN